MGSGPVTGQGGERLGKIDQIAIDLKSGCIAYAVFSIGSVVQLNTKRVAVPWPAFSFSPEGSFIMNVPLDKLQDPPELLRETFPENASATWLEDLYEYYGFKYGPAGAPG